MSTRFFGSSRLPNSSRLPGEGQDPGFSRLPGETERLPGENQGLTRGQSLPWALLTVFLSLFSLSALYAQNYSPEELKQQAITELSRVTGIDFDKLAARSEKTADGEDERLVFDLTPQDGEKSSGLAALMERLSNSGVINLDTQESEPAQSLRDPAENTPEEAHEETEQVTFEDLARVFGEAKRAQEAERAAQGAGQPDEPEEESDNLSNRAHQIFDDVAQKREESEGFTEGPLFPGLAEYQKKQRDREIQAFLTDPVTQDDDPGLDIPVSQSSPDTYNDSPKQTVQVVPAVENSLSFDTQASGQAEPVAVSSESTQEQTIQTVPVAEGQTESLSHDTQVHAQTEDQAEDQTGHVVDKSESTQEQSGIISAERGHVLYKNGQFYEALEIYKQIKNRDGLTWYNMGNCAFKLKKQVHAIIYWRRAQKLWGYKHYFTVEKNIKLAKLFLKVPARDTAHMSPPQLVKYWACSIGSSVEQFLVRTVQVEFWWLLFLLCLVLFLRRLFSRIITKKERQPDMTSLSRGIVSSKNDTKWGPLFLLSLITSISGVTALRFSSHASALWAVPYAASTLYSGPSDRYIELGQIVPGEEVVILDQSGDFVKIVSEEKRGWVLKSGLFDQ